MRDVSPYTGRHSCSKQLVVAGPHIKDQILGHAATHVSRNYTKVAQRPLIDANDLLSGPHAWQALESWEDPLGWSGKLVKTGKR